MGKRSLLLPIRERDRVMRWEMNHPYSYLKNGLRGEDEEDREEEYKAVDKV